MKIDPRFKAVALALPAFGALVVWFGVELAIELLGKERRLLRRAWAFADRRAVVAEKKMERRGC